MDPLAARVIVEILRDSISLDILSRGADLHVTIRSPSPDWVVPQCCGDAAADASRQLSDILSTRGHKQTKE